MSEDSARELWDREAATFDQAPDHGLHPGPTRRAWSEVLLPLFGEAPQRVVDLGCGTGSVSDLLARAGHAVTGVDVSPEMIARARTKTRDLDPAPTFLVGDAASPDLPDGTFDVVLSRHVLWAMPDPADALRTWSRLLGPDGTLLLVEGRWSTGAGIAAQDCLGLVRAERPRASLRMLTDPDLWGGPISDERYLIVS